MQIKTKFRKTYLILSKVYIAMPKNILMSLIRNKTIKDCKSILKYGKTTNTG